MKTIIGRAVVLGVICMFSIMAVEIVCAEFAPQPKPIATYRNGKLASFTVFSDNLKLAERYVFDAKGRCVSRETLDINGKVTATLKYYYGPHASVYDPKGHPEWYPPDVYMTRSGAVASIRINAVTQQAIGGLRDGYVSYAFTGKPNGEVISRTITNGKGVSQTIYYNIKPDAHIPELGQRKVVEAQAQALSADKRVVGTMAIKKGQEIVPVPKKK